MKIKIDEGNTAKIQEALDCSNGGAVAHVATPQDVFRLAARAEQSLCDRGLPVRERAGVEASWQDKGASTKAYSYKMNRTKITLVRGVTNWFLTEAVRAKVRPRQSEQFAIIVTPEQRDRIVREVLTSFHVRSNGVEQSDSNS